MKQNKVTLLVKLTSHNLKECSSGSNYILLSLKCLYGICYLPCVVPFKWNITFWHDVHQWNLHGMLQLHEVLAGAIQSLIVVKRFAWGAQKYVCFLVTFLFNLLGHCTVTYLYSMLSFSSRLSMTCKFRDPVKLLSFLYIYIYLYISIFPIFSQ